MTAELQKIDALIAEVEKVILGKRDVIQFTVAALLAGGHVLFEDIPGVGKTMLVKSLAKAIQSDYKRVQFTPDLLPNDVLGVSIFNSQSHLEAMSENHVTIDNQTYPLSPHFFVLATQNPIEYEGTYPLPEAQLDRFLFRLHIGYPDFQDELALLTGKRQQSLDQIQTILHADEVTALKAMVDDVYVDERVARYALQLVQASRQHNAIDLGISPRGGIAFLKGAKALALTEGRTFVTPQDLQRILPAVFGHRSLL